MAENCWINVEMQWEHDTGVMKQMDSLPRFLCPRLEFQMRNVALKPSSLTSSSSQCLILNWERIFLFLSVDSLVWAIFRVKARSHLESRQMQVMGYLPIPCVNVSITIDTML